MAAEWAESRLADGPILISAASPPDVVARVQQRFGRDVAGHAIENAMASLADRLVDMGVRRLVVAGGETSGAIVDRLSISSFQVGDELAPGVPMLRTIGRPGGDLCMALKSGNFGNAAFFEESLSRLR